MTDTGDAAKQNALTLSLKDKAALYASYMPFVKGGALFVPTSLLFKLGDVVTVVVQFMEEPQKLQFAGKVIWVTPRGAQGGRAAGVGVQISEDGSSELNKKIEAILAGSHKAERATHTL